MDKLKVERKHTKATPTKLMQTAQTKKYKKNANKRKCKFKRIQRGQ